MGLAKTWGAGAGRPASWAATWASSSSMPSLPAPDTAWSVVTTTLFTPAARRRGSSAITKPVVVQFGSAPENVERLTAAVFEEVERLKAKGPTAEDVDRVKEMERRDLETNQRQNAYWLGSLQTVHQYGWDAASILRRPKRTESLTPEMLHGIYRKYFPMDRYTVVTLKPEA